MKKPKQRKTLQKFQTQNLILDNSKNNPEAILNFINDFQNMIHSTDEKTKAISLRVPNNILRMFKSKAARKGLKYQSVITSLMREWIRGA